MALLLLSTCFAPQGDTSEQKRAATQRMLDETLAQLYQQRATSRDTINMAAGYAVFSNVNAHYFFVGGG